MDFNLENDDEELSPKEIELLEEIENVKERLDSARQSVQDTDFYTKTFNVISLPPIKMKIRKSLKAHLAKIVSLDWANDSQHLVTASQDGKLIVWDSYTANKLHMISLTVEWVIGCAYSPNKEMVASGGLDNCISMYNLTLADLTNPHVQLKGHDGYISYIQYLSDSMLVSGSGDKTCRTWDVKEKNETISEFKGHDGDVICLCVHKDNPNLFVTGSSDYSCKLWDVRIAEKYVQVFVGHDADVNGVSFFPNTSYGFVSASDDKNCRLWDFRSDQCIALYEDSNIKGGCTSVTTSKSGRLIIAGYDEYNCYLWDTLREESVGVLSRHENRVSVVKTSPNGVAVATASWDKNCFIWTPPKANKKVKNAAGTQNEHKTG